MPGSTLDPVDGGQGEDLLSYENFGGASETGVSVSLEGTNAEHLTGSEFADVLVGDGGSNAILGLGGDDRIDGRGGTDELGAGSGDDALEARDGVADSADCGPGSDSIATDPPGVDALSGCERVLFPEVAGPGGPGDGASLPPPRFVPVTLALATARISPRGPLPVRISNPNGFAVSGTLSGKSSERRRAARRQRSVKLAGKPFAVPGLAARVVRLALPRPLRRRLARDGRLSVRVTARLRDPAATRAPVTRVLTPRLAR